MRRRPWPLVLLAIFHILAPIGNLLVNAKLREVPVGPYFLSHFQIENTWHSLIFFGVPPVAGLAIYACKKWSLWVYLFCIGLLISYSTINFVNHVGPVSVAPILMFYFVNLTLVLYFLVPAVRNIYLDERIRWWESAPRYACQFKADYSLNSVPATGQVMNISETGLFIRSQQVPRDKIQMEILLRIGEEAHKFVGQVLHHNRQDEVGFALKLEHTPHTRRDMGYIIQKLDREGQSLNQAQFATEDGFTSWFLRLIKTGKGLLPESKK